MKTKTMSFRDYTKFCDLAQSFGDLLKIYEIVEKQNAKADAEITDFCAARGITRDDFFTDRVKKEERAALTPRLPTKLLTNAAFEIAKAGDLELRAAFEKLRKHEKFQAYGNFFYVAQTMKGDTDYTALPW